jgi:hypothetical protein
LPSRRGSDWIFRNFSFIFIEKIYNAWEHNFTMIQIKRTFLLYQHILWLSHCLTKAKVLISCDWIVTSFENKLLIILYL